jgi:predicted urease superfamily metal-dependent hydrolase
VVDRFKALIDSRRKKIEEVNERIDVVAKNVRPNTVDSFQIAREHLETERRVWETAIENLQKTLEEQS